MNLINWGLMKNPFNWFKVTLMVLFGFIAFHLVMDQITGHPSNKEDE